MAGTRQQAPVVPEQTEAEKRAAARRILEQEKAQPRAAAADAAGWELNQQPAEASHRTWDAAPSFGGMLTGLVFGAAAVALWSEFRRRSQGERDLPLALPRRATAVSEPEAPPVRESRVPATPAEWLRVGFTLQAPHLAVLELVTCEGTTDESKVTDAVTRIGSLKDLVRKDGLAMPSMVVVGCGVSDDLADQVQRAGAICYEPRKGYRMTQSPEERAARLQAELGQTPANRPYRERAALTALSPDRPSLEAYTSAQSGYAEADFTEWLKRLTMPDDDPAKQD